MTIGIHITSKENISKSLLLLFQSIFLFLVIFLFLFISSFQPVSAQSFNDIHVKLSEQLHSLAANAPRELAYIQTSKDIYETGEDLWFKVYLLDAQFLTPSLLSQTLYLQLLSEDNMKVVWAEKYEILDGFASGRVYLESNLTEGNYFLAAYTTNSFFGDTTEFKAIRKIIVRKDITAPASEPERSEKSHIKSKVSANLNAIQFNTFPECGELVAGLKNRVAFKAVSKDGEPVDIEGTLFENEIPLLEFKSIHAGMGSFNFIPDARKKYLIRLSKPGIDSSYVLPEISTDGITMDLIERNKESLYFKISQSPGHEEEDVYLRVQCRGVVYGMTSGKLTGELLIKIPLEELPQGIAEVTLFNSKLMPVAERLVYINQERKLNISTELSKDIFGTRGKATLRINVKDEKGNPVVANLGVSVFDKLYQNPRDSNNILAHFYLSEQLKGRIYNPSYYFNSRNKGREKALDLLMITQGWRKYVWNEANLENSKELKPVITDETSGTILYPHRRKKIPRKQVFVMAFSPNMDSLNVLISADPAGRFTVTSDLLKKWETDYVYLKPVGPPGSQFAFNSFDPLAMPEFILGIKITDPFEIISNQLKADELVYPLPALLKEPLINTDSYLSETGVVKIKEVTIKGKKQNILRGKYMGLLDSLATKDDYNCVFGVLNCPRHTPDQPPPILYYPTRYPEKKPIPGKEYFVIYNYNTPAEKVRTIVYRLNRYSEEDLLKLHNFSRVKAYYGDREFYKPDYDQEKGDTLIPDFRNTLLWDPSVITDEKGEATVSFYCSDINTDFVGRIEGVSDEGLLGAGYFKFTVRKLKSNSY